MTFNDKQKLSLLMVSHLCWGLVLRLSISKYGLGISTDSVHLLFGGLNLAEGRGLYSFDGSFLILWPPLYSVLLGFVHLIIGWSVFAAANVLQIVSFLGLSVCLSVLFLKIFPDDFLLAFTANLLSDVGMVILITFHTVGSDYIHLFFVILFVLLTGYYIESKNLRFLLAMSVIGMLAMLQRYLGVAVIAMGVFLTFIYAHSLRERILRSALLASSALPAGAWLVITSPLIDRRAPIPLADNFQWFSKSIIEWFLPADAVEANLWVSIVCLWLVLIALIILLIKFSPRYKPFSSFSTPVFAYGIFYLLALFGTASVAYYNKLDGRFLLPLYIPFILLLVASFGILLRLASGIHSPTWARAASVCVIGILVFIGMRLAAPTLSVVLETYDNGAAGDNAFNTKAWNENKAMLYWLNHTPKGSYLLLSNYPDGVSFFTGRPSFASPKRFVGPYSKDEISLDQYPPELFSSGEDVYVIWVEPNIYDFYYSPKDLSAIAEIKTLYQGTDGGVYQLSPKSNGRD
jgi:hypothetical protein